MTVDLTSLKRVIQIIRRTPPHNRLQRACNRDDIIALLAALSNAKRRVRRYSHMGFVPYLHAGRCGIQFVEATRADDNSRWVLTTGWATARRRRYRSDLLVVQ